jgi:hypothetical protein
VAALVLACNARAVLTRAAQGEGFIRISSFGHREDVLEAVDRLVKVLKK